MMQIRKESSYTQTTGELSAVNGTAQDNATAHALLALAEGLDFPRLELVVPSTENPVLHYLAPIPEFDLPRKTLMSWLESMRCPEELLHQLQTDYYRMFLQPGTDLFLYLHLWYPNESPAAFLGELQTFFWGTGLTQSPEWSNGRDHLALVFELLAYMITTQNPALSSFLLRYFHPWFSTFARRMREQAANDFYRAMSVIAGEVSHFRGAGVPARECP